LPGAPTFWNDCTVLAPEKNTLELTPALATPPPPEPTMMVSLLALGPITQLCGFAPVLSFEMPTAYWPVSSAGPCSDGKVPSASRTAFTDAAVPVGNGGSVPLPA